MTAPPTLSHLFFDAIDRYSSKRAALRYKANGTWREITHQELGRQVRHLALGLRELGVEPGDRIAILSANRPEWAVADYSSLTLRCCDVPLYPTLTSQQVAYILSDSGAIAVFVSDPQQYTKVAQERQNLPNLKHVIYFEGSGYGSDATAFQEVTQRGAGAESKYPDYEQEALEAKPADVATLIYTSGTTGQPKGVMLTHGNLCNNVVAALQALAIAPDDSALSLLPLSHSFERMAGHYTMFHAGVTINYAQSFDEVAQNMLEVRPTVMLAVPRFFEKIFARVLESAMAGGAVKRRIFFWARQNAERCVDLKLAKQPVPTTLAIKKNVADKLVFSKLRARTGGRIRFFISGGAPLSPEIAKFFFAAGLPILEGYGLTETSPVISVNTYEEPRIGTVGKPIPGVEVKIADDGEILCRGHNVMKGYYNRPEATAEAIDADGWFHTGDVGEIDRDGYIKITDRKKDLIVTAGGKNIAPQPIENKVKTNKFVLNAVMIGDRRKFPVMLVVPNPDALKEWAAERSMPITELSELLNQPDVTAKVEREVMINLRDLASYQMPKKILLIQSDFTIESGELTPTLKVKRNVVEQNYKDLIDALYEG